MSCRVCGWPDYTPVCPGCLRVECDVDADEDGLYCVAHGNACPDPEDAPNA